MCKVNDSDESLVIYVDEKSSIKAFFTDSRIRPKECFVIFSELGGRSLCTKVGGADPLLREGYDVICVQSNCDDWHQNIAIEGIDKLQCFLKQKYQIAKGYGSSMGGFAAISYAHRLDLKTVLALSPQYTISESFDTRWSRYNRNIVWHQTAEMAHKYAGVIHLVYDPLNLDAKHAELICNTFGASDILRHEIKFGSHPTTHYFHDGGVLKKLLLSFAIDDLVIPMVDRKKNKTYLTQVSHYLLKKSKPRLAKAAIQHSIELGNERHPTYRQASNISHRLKEMDDAITFARKAVDAKDNDDLTRADHKEHLANMLRIAGKLDDALRTVDEVIQTGSDRFTAYTVKADILFDMQQAEEAKLTIQRSIELGEERHFAYRQASNISHHLKETDDAITFARKAVDAKDNNDQTRAKHEAHLANMLRIAGKLN